MTPSAWASAYVGLPYVLGEGECGHRAAAVWRDRFGFDVKASAANGDLHKARRIIKEQMSDPDWHRVEAPQEGDAVVMRKGLLICHVGVWVEPGFVLHCSRARGMVLTALHDLPEEGFHVVAYFRRVEEAELKLAA